jgi:nucleoside-diphosphate-sugar epimerase
VSLDAPSSLAAREKRCVITGTGGYVGSRIAQRFRNDGWQVVRLSRSAAAAPDVVSFQLGQEVSPSALAGASTLIHCAHDFRPSKWNDIHAVNVVGAERLFHAAKQAGVERAVFISSVSAFAGCRSLYGQAKLHVEEIARSIGGWVIRPGLVWGNRPGGLFGRVVRAVNRIPIVPLPAGGPQIQYLVNDADLSEIVCRAAGCAPRSPNAPVTVAHPRPWLFRDLVREVARVLDRRPLLFPVPWRTVWLPLRLGEAVGIPVGFNSDNLVSFVHQHPNPTFDAAEVFGIQCREFRLDSAWVSSLASAG